MCNGIMSKKTTSIPWFKNTLLLKNAFDLKWETELPLCWTLQGHCGVIVWPHFHLVVSERIWRPEERERGDGTASRWCRWNTHGVYRSGLPSCLGARVVLRIDSSSIVTDYWSQITVRSVWQWKHFTYCKNCQKCSTETGSEQTVLEKWSR